MGRRGRPSMTEAYETLGVESYYRAHHDDYRNVHFPQIVNAVRVAMTKLEEVAQLAGARVLDLACGSGEATLAMQRWETERGRPADARLCIEGADPYTGDAFAARTNKRALSISFEDIANGKLIDEGLAFDVCVCSFALHLVQERSRLWSLLTALGCSCRFLLVLSPHKKPTIEDSMGWEAVFVARVDRVLVRLYRSQHCREQIPGSCPEANGHPRAWCD